MENNSFISSILAALKAKVNQFALNRLHESGRFDADHAYYTMQGETLGEYASSIFFSQLFTPKRLKNI